MIYIANPIYDAVFKFLLEDKEYLERAYQETLGKLETEVVQLKGAIEQKDKALE